MQKLGGNAMLVDAEHAFDPAYSKALGVDIENLIVCQPDNGEMALESRLNASLPNIDPPSTLFIQLLSSNGLSYIHIHPFGFSSRFIYCSTQV